MNVLKDYEILSVIGEGTFGVVKLSKVKETGEKVAIKILEKKKIINKDDEERVTREIDMLKRVHHINVIKIFKIEEDEENLYLIMEFCEKGELFNHIVEETKLGEIEAAYFYYQLINGLECIHHNGIVHRDLKPENLLLTEGYILKIIDFGLGNYFEKEKLLTTPCGSPCYASPEMVSGQKYNGFMIDIWSTGIILYAMLCGYLPFEDQDNEILFQKILSCEAEFPDDLSYDSIDLMKKIMITDPKKRITIPEIKKHPFYLKGKRKFESKYPDLVSEIEKDYNEKERSETKEEKEKRIVDELKEGNDNKNTLEIKKENQENRDKKKDDYIKIISEEFWEEMKKSSDAIDNNIENLDENNLNYEISSKKNPSKETNEVNSNVDNIINNNKLDDNLRIESIYSEIKNNNLEDNRKEKNINKNSGLELNQDNFNLDKTEEVKKVENMMKDNNEFINNINKKKEIINNNKNEKPKQLSIKKNINKSIKHKNVKGKTKKGNNNKNILQKIEIEKILEEIKPNGGNNINYIFENNIASKSEIQDLNLISNKEGEKLNYTLDIDNKYKLNSQRNEKKIYLMDDNIISNKPNNKNSNNTNIDFENLKLDKINMNELNRKKSNNQNIKNKNMIPNLKSKINVSGNKIKNKNSLIRGVRKAESLSNNNNEIKIEKQIDLRNVSNNNKNVINNTYDFAITEINDKKENININNINSAKNEYPKKLNVINNRRTEIQERKKNENILMNTNNNGNNLLNKRPKLYPSNKNNKNKEKLIPKILNTNNNSYANTISTISNSLDRVNNKIPINSLKNYSIRNTNYTQKNNKENNNYPKKIRINNYKNISQNAKKININFINNINNGYDERTFNQNLNINNIYYNNNYRDINTFTENHSLFSDILYRRKFDIDAKNKNSVINKDNQYNFNIINNNINNLKKREGISDNINKMKTMNRLKINENNNNNLINKKNIYNPGFSNIEHNKTQINNYQNINNKTQIRTPLNKNNEIGNKTGYNNNRRNHNYYISSGKGMDYANLGKKSSDLNTIRKNETIDYLKSNSKEKRYINAQFNDHIPKYKQRLLGLFSNSAEKYKINNYINNFTINNLESPINLYSAHNHINTIESNRNIPKRIKSNFINNNNSSYNENIHQKRINNYKNNFTNRNTNSSMRYKMNNKLLKNGINYSYQRPKENDVILIEENNRIYDTSTRPNYKYLSNYNLKLNLNENKYPQFNNTQTDLGDLYDNKLTFDSQERITNTNYRNINLNNKRNQNTIISQYNNKNFERKRLNEKNTINNTVKGNISNINHINTINNYNRINNINKKNYIHLSNNINKKEKTILKHNTNVQDLLLTRINKESNFKTNKNFQNSVFNNKISDNGSNIVNLRKKEKLLSSLSQDINSRESENYQYIRPRNVSNPLMQNFLEKMANNQNKKEAIYSRKNYNYTINQYN